MARLRQPVPDGRPRARSPRSLGLHARPGQSCKPCWPAAASAAARNRPTHLAAELAQVAKAIGPGAPVKLVWTREDDISGGYYRPLFVHRMRGAIDATARSSRGRSRSVGPVLPQGLAVRGDDQGRHRSDLGRGRRASFPTTSPNFRCDLHTTDVGVPTLWWRSVGHTHTGYAVEMLRRRTARRPPARIRSPAGWR